MPASAMLCFASPASIVCSLCPAHVLTDGAKQRYHSRATEMGSLAVSHECCSLHLQASQSPNSQRGCKSGEGRYQKKMNATVEMALLLRCRSGRSTGKPGCSCWAPSRAS